MSNEETLDEWLIRAGESADFERDDVSIQALNRLRDLVSQREAENELLKVDAERRGHEYSSEQARLQGILATMGVSLDFAASAQVAGLADVFLHLELSDVELSSAMLTIGSLQREIDTLEDLLESKEKERADLSQASRHIGVQLGILQQSLSQQEARHVEQEKRQAAQSVERKYMRTKRGQYQEALTKQKEAVEASGISSELTHGALVEQAAEIARVQARCVPLSQALRGYRDLPPDLLLARVKVTEAEGRLSDLQHQLAERIRRLRLPDS